MDYHNKWLDEVNTLMADIKSARCNIEKIFPDFEHLRPLKELPKYLRAKVIEFYRSDIYRLVPYGRLLKLEQDAAQLGVTANGTYLMHLKDMIRRAEGLRQSMIAQSRNMSYELAKQFFGDCMDLGIAFSEAQTVKEVIRVNFEIEVCICDEVTDTEIKQLIRILADEGDKVDRSFMDTVMKTSKEFEALEAELKQILELNKIDFKHLKKMEMLNDKFKGSKLVPPKLNQFQDLFASFSFCVTLCLEKGVKAASLEIALSTLLELLNKMLDQDHTKLMNVLIPIRNIEFSINPIKNFLEAAKVLLWRSDIKSAFTAPGGIDHQMLSGLLSIPVDALRISDQAVKEYQMASEILSHASKFRKACNEYIQCFDRLFEIESSSQIRKAVDSVTEMYGVIDHTYKNQELSLNKDLQSCFEKVEKKKPILTACRQVVKLMNEEFIDIESFVMLCNMLNIFEQDSRKHSALVNNLVTIVKKYQPSLEAINKTITLMKSGEHYSQEDFKTPDFLALLKKQSQKVKTFDFDFHMQKLGSIVDLGYIGQSFRQCLDEVARWEKETRMIVEKNPIKKLMSFTTSAELELLLDKTLNLKQNFIKSVFYSEALEEVIKYRWSLKVIKCFCGPSRPLAHFTGLLSRLVPKDDLIRKLRNALKDQLREYKHVRDVFKDVPATKPLSSDIRSVRSRLLRLKVVLSSAQISEYLASYKRVRSSLARLKMEPKPTVEALQKYIAKLGAEKITYTEETEALQTKLEEVQSLVSKYRNCDSRSNDKYKIIRRYKELNVAYPPFETAIREVNLDSAVETEFELGLTIANTYEELSLLEDKVDTVSDLTWVKNIKERIFLKKSRIVESANEGNTEFALTITELTMMFWQVSDLHSANEEVQLKLKKLTELISKVNEMTKKLMLKVGGSTMAEIERLSKVKRRILNVVDITPQIDTKIKALKHKLETMAQKKKAEEDKAAAQAAQLKEASDPLGKRKPESDSHRYGRTDAYDNARRKPKAEDEEAARGTGTRVSGLKLTERETDTRRRQRGAEVPSFVGPKPSEQLMVEKTTDIAEPTNSTGTWQLFKGVVKNDQPHTSFDDVQFISVEDWNFIRSFPPLPLSLCFKSKISKDDVQNFFDNMTTDGNSKVLPGFIRLEAGVDREAFRKNFKASEPNNCHLLEYCRTVFLVLIPARSFPSAWFHYFSQSDLARTADCDFYFFVLNMNKEEYTGPKINLVSADRLGNKENGAFNFENFRETRPKEKERKSTRLTPKLNSVLAANSSAVNRSRLETSGLIN